MPYCFSTRQPPRISGTASLGSLHDMSARHVYQSPLTRGGHSSSIVSSCGFRGGREGRRDNAHMALSGQREEYERLYRKDHR